MSRFTWLVASLATLALGVAGPAWAAEFYPIDDIISSTADFDLFPDINLIQGPGIGFDDAEPYNKILGGADGNWVTEACGFPCDYIENFGTPVLEMDLGQDRELSEISIWGYASTNANGVSEFSLRFATDADGPAGYGNSIAFNPTYGDFPNDDTSRMSFPFGQSINARYVELTAEDNFFVAPGDGSGGETPGGDRVGLGEIAFVIPGTEAPPQPPIEFYPIVSIENDTEDTDLWPVSNLIQGPGIGFQDSSPYNKILTGPDGNWVTEACGFPCDYIETTDTPVLRLDLGEDRPLSEIDVWGYASTNANGVSEFSLRFATDADGPGGFGSSVSYNPTFSDLPIDDTARLVFPFDQTVTARYVEFTAEDNFFEAPGDGSGGETPGGDRVGLGEIAFPVSAGGAPMLQAGDADMNLRFDQLDLVRVQVAAKYLTGQPATWGEGDWNGAPGGSPGDPPPGDQLFDQLDIIAALAADVYLTGPYAALQPQGTVGDAQTSIIYNATTGEVSVDAPAGVELTSVNVDSAAGIFTGDAAQNLGGSFDNDADNNIFKATFGGSFASLSFGNVAQTGLSEDFVANDLTVVGSLAGGGDLGQVDLIYVPEPSSLLVLTLGLMGILIGRARWRR